MPKRGPRLLITAELVEVAGLTPQPPYWEWDWAMNSWLVSEVEARTALMATGKLSKGEVDALIVTACNWYQELTQPKERRTTYETWDEMVERRRKNLSALDLPVVVRSDAFYSRW